MEQVIVVNSAATDQDICGVGGGNGGSHGACGQLRQRGLDVARVDWIGTSMGGLIGMMLAAQPETPLRRLVINDVGPFIPKAALERIGTYLGTDTVFADMDAAETHLRTIHAPFGALTDAQWWHLTEHSLRPVEGGFRLRYDPRIGEAVRDGATGRLVEPGRPDLLTRAMEEIS